MKGHNIILKTSIGIISINVNEYWLWYLHSKEVHPERPALRDALNHALDGRIAPDAQLPMSVINACGEVVEFFTEHAVPGRVFRALQTYAKNTTPEQRLEHQVKQYRNFVLQNYNFKGHLQ